MFEKIFSDYVEMGISLLAGALVLAVLFNCWTVSDKYHEKQLESQIVSEEIREQRNNLFYDNTHCYQQDVIALILRYKGDREVHVKLEDGTILEWSTDTQSSKYKVSEISALMPKDVLYDADLIHGQNPSQVIGYQFVEHETGCGR